MWTLIFEFLMVYSNYLLFFIWLNSCGIYFRKKTWSAHLAFILQRWTGFLFELFKESHRSEHNSLDQNIVKIELLTTFSQSFSVLILAEITFYVLHKTNRICRRRNADCYYISKMEIALVCFPGCPQEWYIFRFDIKKRLCFRNYAFFKCSRQNLFQERSVKLGWLKTIVKVKNEVQWIEYSKCNILFGYYEYILFNCFNSGYRNIPFTHKD